ncbi:MAG: U32 family peptidase [Bacteroidales bacterium]|nr:U32 family peptidase [Bacteroidales bacterium]
MELLSPAKNSETGICAINSGADAVYIGASDFGARKSASNSLKDIETLVNYAHFYNSKVYVTLNTILYDNELPIAQKLIKDLYNIGVDALIVQDTGILEMDIPPIELHASTQMNNYDFQRIKFFDDLGFKRIVLARECGLEDIKKIRENIKAEIECFVHGALCVSFSGQCYMSAKIGSRSANRGECAQACRLKYSLFNNKEKLLIKDSYVLSLKDFAMYDKISDLINAGVNSLKIEGRLKDIPYVKNVTAYYRKIIDSCLENGAKKTSSGKCFFDFEPDLQKVFNRGFTHYFVYGGKEKKANFFSPKSIGEFLGTVVSKKQNTLIIKGDKKISNGDGLCFVKDNSLRGFRVEKVLSGGALIVNTDENIRVGEKIFRNLDTEFLRKLSSEKTLRKIGVKITLNLMPDDFYAEICDEDGIEVKMPIPFAFQKAENVEKSLSNIEQNFKKTGEKFYVTEYSVVYETVVPFFPNSVIAELRRAMLESLSSMRIERFAAKPLDKPQGDVKYFRETGDYRMNVSNALAKQFYEKHGCKIVQPAFELLKKTSGLELMTTKYCIRRELGFCPKTCKNVPPDWKTESFSLKNEYGVFTLKFDCKDCVMRIFA